MAVPDGETAAAWAAAWDLANHVAVGGSLAVVTPTVLLRPGELQHAQLLMDMSQFTGMDVEYSTGYAMSGGLIGMAAGLAVSAAANANARRRAEAMARPQWRPVGRCPVIVTNQRLFLGLHGTWSSIWYSDLVQLAPNVAGWSVVLSFEGASAIMLRSPWAPWMTVAICAALYQQPWLPGVDYRGVFGAGGITA